MFTLCVNAVVSEAMRLYPPAWTIERDALAADDVGGVKVPAGSLVAIPPYLVHRHPEFWPGPAGFDPAGSCPGAPEIPSDGTGMRSYRSAAGNGPASERRSPNWRLCWCSPRSRAGSGWS
jgi:hypothetical protein